ncbi:hypothetical protein LTR62_002071 [Meristemomyces frigidus]|uniref:Leo1-like protein n=1 Tax=Meristemomyces frigidus TaxID=1508187 RepID=A0AAN7TTE4_9PEZI|nr:hypothetical protein LTR62_002071 [Meristemomyces frigidus]
MASVAAVAVKQELSPLRNQDLDDGEVTSAIGSKADGNVDFIGDEDIEDDVRGTARRKIQAEVTPAGDGNSEVASGDAGDADLFGDDEPGPPAKRKLDDEELDSGDDLDRTDRVGEDEQLEEEPAHMAQQLSIMDVEMGRQPLPEPSDGEMYLLKMPDFMAIEPKVWSHTDFQPPTTEHHSNKPASASFSAYNTALSTIRWRHSPLDPKTLQSNARILRWSDGSCTLQLGSQSTVQYEVDGNALAPPQRNPLRPTPVSVQVPGSKSGRQGDGTVLGEKYDQSKDAFTYLVVPNEATSTLRVTHKITAGLSMRQPASVQDDAIERLQAALSTAANAVKVVGPGGELELVDEDPESQRRKAEKFMAEKARADLRKQRAAEREADRSNRTLGRNGLSSSRYGGGGLNAGMLEDEDGMGTTRGRKMGTTPKKSRQRRNSIYSDDEDFGRKHFTSKEDEYDNEDGFVATSDDEEEVVDDDEDEDDGIVDDSRREQTPKRDRETANGGDDADAEGEADEGVQQARPKRRRIVDEDEDEE